VSALDYKPDGADAGIGCAAVLLDIPYRTWVASLLWSWFMVPLGLAPIGFMPMLGVLCVTGIIIRHYPASRKYTDSADYLGNAAQPVIFTTISLVFGAFFKFLAVVAA
jgi:hypothetical protein